MLKTEGRFRGQAPTDDVLKDRRVARVQGVLESMCITRGTMSI